jgi:septal ring factor EnvC (AmiA/AmiB activator)
MAQQAGTDARCLGPEVDCGAFGETEGEAASWRRRLKAREQVLAEERQELAKLEEHFEERIAAFEEREARSLVELDLKQEELEHRERTVAELEERLRRKEQDLNRYVGQLQSRLTLAS